MLSDIVKWFDPKRGYGSITKNDSKDAFLHWGSIVKNDGFLVQDFRPFKKKTNCRLNNDVKNARPDPPDHVTPPFSMFIDHLRMTGNGF